MRVVNPIVEGPYPRGLRGDPGLIPMGDWVEGEIYPRNAIVRHGGEVQWLALKRTSVEPGDAAPSDWMKFLDATSASDARAQTIAARDAAVAASGVSVAARNAAIDAKDEAVAAQASAVGANVEAQAAAAESDAARDAALATERRIRAQDLGDFADDAAALAWAAAQTPPIAVVVGTSYWNTATLIKRICSDSTTTPKSFVDEDADAAIQRTNAQTAAVAAAGSAAQAAADRAAMEAKYLGSKTVFPTVDALGNPVVEGAKVWRSDKGREFVYTGEEWKAAAVITWPVSGAPANSFGEDGDLAVDGPNMMRYGPKAAGAWPAGVSFGGPGMVTVNADKALAAADRNTLFHDTGGYNFTIGTGLPEGPLCSILQGHVSNPGRIVLSGMTFADMALPMNATGGQGLMITIIIMPGNKVLVAGAGQWL